VKVKLNKKPLLKKNKHFNEIDKLAQEFELRKRFIVERIKYYKTLLLEKKENENTLLSNLNIDMNNNISFSYIDKSVYATNTIMIDVNDKGNTLNYNNTVKKSINNILSNDDFFKSVYLKESIHIGRINSFDTKIFNKLNN